MAGPGRRFAALPGAVVLASTTVLTSLPYGNEVVEDGALWPWMKEGPRC